MLLARSSVFFGSISRGQTLCRSKCLHRHFYATSLNASSSSSLSSSVATKGEIDALRDEIRALQDLVRQTKSEAQEARSLAQQIEAQSSHVETSLREIHERVVSTSLVELVTTAAKEYVQRNETLNKVLSKIEGHRGIFNWYTAGGAALLLVAIWWYRVTVYEKTSEEVANLASRTLRQDELRATIQETLSTVASSPDTLATLNDLLQKLIRDQSTVEELVQLLVYSVGTPEVQKALLDLLEVVFQDAELQRLAGEFLLKGLDEDDIRHMLEEQTQDLVRQTVSDESVQQATARGVQKSLWYAMTPPFLWNKKKEDVGESESESDRVDGNASSDIQHVQQKEGEEDGHSSQ